MYLPLLSIHLLYHKKRQKPSKIRRLCHFYHQHRAAFSAGRMIDFCSISRPSMSHRNCCQEIGLTSLSLRGHLKLPFSKRLYSLQIKSQAEINELWKFYTGWKKVQKQDHRIVLVWYETENDIRFLRFLAKWKDIPLPVRNKYGETCLPRQSCKRNKVCPVPAFYP